MAKYVFTFNTESTQFVKVIEADDPEKVKQFIIESYWAKNLDDYNNVIIPENGTIIPWYILTYDVDHETLEHWIETSTLPRKVN